MKPDRLLRPALAVAVIAALAAGGYLTRETWLPWLRHDKAAESAQRPGEAVPALEKVVVSDQAQKNLGLTARQLQVQTVWKTIPVPGMVVDRPGWSDRNVVAPATGVVVRVAHTPGDAVRAGEALFALRLTSESLHQAQTNLFKTTQDIALARAQRERLEAAGESVPETRLIEAKNQITRLNVAAKAYRRELLNRGLTPGQVEEAAGGRFVNEITVAAPAPPADSRPLTASLVAQAAPAPAGPPVFEVQELKVELGQQVQAGHTLCLLANHQALAVEGRAFPGEAPLLERSVRDRRPVRVDFREDDRADWPVMKQTFRIRQMANTIDPVKRTFGFLIPLENQSRLVEDDGRTQVLWRFRPGQKVRVLVDVERHDNVFLLPPEAVARDGPEAFVFTQNVNTFERRPVRVVLQERDRVVIANDGSLPTYEKASPTRPRGEAKEVWTIPAVALKAAAQLNRMVKAGAGAPPKGYHVHADGSLHKNHE
jgi:biotin carboxyl carrier protein